MSDPGTRDTNTSGPGGYLLHSPDARAAAGVFAIVHTLVIAAVTAVAAAEAGNWGFHTFALLGVQLAFCVVLAVVPWREVSNDAFAKIYFFGSGAFVAAAFHLGNPYLLLGVFPELVAFADVFWTHRRKLFAHWTPVLAAYLAGALTIGGSVNEGLALIALPLMVFAAAMVGATSNYLSSTLLARRRFQSTVTSLLEALHARDGYTGEHSEMTVAMTAVVGDRMGLSCAQKEQLADVALLHDIGKIGIPNSILQKPGALDDDEWRLMREHPEIGERILRDIPGFDAVATAIRHEHERWDGGGYPDGIAGDAIPLESRIVLACDAFHAMISDRPYRKAMSREDAIAELRDNAGTQFDFDVVNALVDGVLSGDVDREIVLNARLAVEREQQAADGAILRLVPKPDEDVDDGDGATGSSADTAGFSDDEIGELTDDNAQAAPRRVIEPLTDPRVRAAVGIAQALQGVVLIGLYTLLAPLHWASVLYTSVSAAMLLVSVALIRWDTPKLWTVVSGMTAYALVPLLTWQLQEPAMLLLLCTPAIGLTAFFWHRPLLRAASVALMLFEFVALPVIVFGGTQLTLAAVSSRAFPGVILMVGYFAPRVREMSFDRARFSGTMRSLLQALQARDGYTGEHSLETVELAMRVASELGLDDARRAELNDVALLHDIGKIGIPDEILHKPGKLDSREWEIMKTHPVVGEQIVGRIPGFESIAKAIRHEHERWDGGGYPDGIAGERIPVASRIVLVCDAFHAMTSDRPYRAAMPISEAIGELERNAGSQFDPRVVAALTLVLADERDEAGANAGSDVRHAVAG